MPTPPPAATGQPVLPIPSQPPDGVDPEHWARLCTADAVRGYTPGPLPHVVRATIEGLLRPACAEQHSRVAEVIETADRQGDTYAQTWLWLREEWGIRERLFAIEFTTPAEDSVTLTENRSGDFTLTVTQDDADPGAGHVSITVPAKKIYDLAAAVSIHASPVHRTADQNTCAGSGTGTDRTENT